MSKDALYQLLEERRLRHSADAALHRAVGQHVKAAVAQAWADATEACLTDAHYALDDEAEPTDYDAWVEAAIGGYVP